MRIATPGEVVKVEVSRRDALGLAAAVVALGLPGAAGAAGSTLVPTPRNALGPFYPDAKPADSDADLTQVAGQSTRAQGTLLHVSGRVLDLRGVPVPKAAIEVWQANTFGRYTHPRDGDSAGPLDPGFQGYGRMVSAADGSYRFVTIKPPPYSGRTPHIHFIVATPRTRLTTQMFFESEPLNERDFLYRSLAAAERDAATGRYIDRAVAAQPPSLAVTWDIVLAG